MVFVHLHSLASKKLRSSSRSASCLYCDSCFKLALCFFVIGIIRYALRTGLVNYLVKRQFLTPFVQQLLYHPLYSVQLLLIRVRITSPCSYVTCKVCVNATCRYKRYTVI